MKINDFWYESRVARLGLNFLTFWGSEKKVKK